MGKGIIFSLISSVAFCRVQWSLQNLFIFKKQLKNCMRKRFGTSGTFALAAPVIVGTNMVWGDVEYPLIIVIPFILALIIWIFVLIIYLQKRTSKAKIPAILPIGRFLRQPKPVRGKGRRKLSGEVRDMMREEEKLFKKLDKVSSAHPAIEAEVRMPTGKEEVFLEKIDRIMEKDPNLTPQMRLYRRILEIRGFLNDGLIKKAEDAYSNLKDLFERIKPDEQAKFEPSLRRLRVRIQMAKMRRMDNMRKIASGPSGSTELDRAESSIWQKLRSL
jgi:hypothetical protein